MAHIILPYIVFFKCRSVNYSKYLLIELYLRLKKLCEKIGMLYGEQYNREYTCRDLYKYFYMIYTMFDEAMYSSRIFRNIPSISNTLIDRYNDYVR